MNDIVLFPHQAKLKQETYDAWNSGITNILDVLPTGGGKSVVVSDITLDGARQGMMQAVIAHRNELVAQMSMHVARRGIPHRIVGPDTMIAQITRQHRASFNGQSYINPKAPTSVVGVDTLMARAEDLKDWAAQHDRWTIDEGHHVLRQNKWGRAVEMFPRAKGLGVTATAIRADGMGLGRAWDGVFDHMVVGPSMRELIDGGFLADYEIVCPPSDLEMHEEDITEGGDYSQKKLRDAARKSRIVGDVVENYCRYAFGKKAIVFATDVETAGKIAQNFNNVGIRAAALSAKTPTAVREKYVAEFRAGKLTILINVDLFGEGFDCLDEETEVLTPNGWKNYQDAEFETYCYALNSETEKIEIVPVQAYKIRETEQNEKMWSVKSQHADIRVTEGHNIYYKKMNHFKKDGMSENILVKTAGKIHADKKAFAIPLAAEMEFSGLNLSDEEIQLIGWYLTDGWIQKSSLVIAQSKPEGIEKICYILNVLGLDYKTRTRNNRKGAYQNARPQTEFIIPKGNGRKKRNGWKKLEPYLKKVPSELLHKMTREQFFIFWQSLLDGDGSRQKNKSGTLTCSSKEQADFYLHAATIRGFAVMYGTYKTKNNVQIYTVRIRDNKWLRMKPTDSRGAKFELNNARPGEKVWCLTNKLGTLITRRNGRVAILGNCPDCEVVIMARPTASLGLYLQMCGRALRTAAGKIVGLLIDHVGNIVRHKYPDKKHIWSLARRDKRGKKAKDPDDLDIIVCKFCSRPYEAFLPKCSHCGMAPPLPEPRERTIEMVAGDLILLDRAKLEELRRATMMESAADVGQRVATVAGSIAAKMVINKHIEKIGAHQRLADTIAQWAGVMRARGRTDSESYRIFYLTAGMDVLTALDASRTRQEFESLTAMVEGWYMKGNAV